MKGFLFGKYLKVALTGIIWGMQNWEDGKQ
jgi:hypothetical protein